MCADLLPNCRLPHICPVSLEMPGTISRPPNLPANQLRLMLENLFFPVRHPTGRRLDDGSIPTLRWQRHSPGRVIGQVSGEGVMASR